MTTILGINAFHPDAAACLLVDGKLVAAVAEERLGRRVKHFPGFPAEAIGRVLQMSGASLGDVDYLAVGHDHNANLAAKAAYVARSPLRSAHSVFTHIWRRGRLASLQELCAQACGAPISQCRFKVVPVEHHLAHLASAYFASPFDRAGGFSYDAAGDFVSGMYARMEGQEIEVLRRVFLPHSLGFFYTAICQFIGFERFGDEYKVMGLAAYGEPEFADLMHRCLRHSGGGRYRLNQKFFKLAGDRLDECVDEHGQLFLPLLYSGNLVRLAGPPRRRDAELTTRDKNLAASCQRHFEDVVAGGLQWLHAQTGGENLVTAGGCALNGVCNSRILRDTPYTRSYIQCAASDDGTAVGAALYTWNCILKGPRSPLVDHAFWGPEYPERELEQALQDAKLPYARLEGQALLDHVTRHLVQGHVTGWYQGRSEWGPRALGNRSILAHPGFPGMKDLINSKIKRREPFRPFAPTILAEKAGEYFEQAVESPFMMHVVKIRPEKRALIPAVTHVDGTGRLHTVKHSQNPRYYELIRTFERASGIPVVLNTSFNENEPIVDRPEQAVECFRRTDLDVLCLGPFVTAKPGKEA